MPHPSLSFPPAPNLSSIVHEGSTSNELPSSLITTARPILSLLLTGAGMTTFHLVETRANFCMKAKERRTPQNLSLPVKSYTSNWAYRKWKWAGRGPVRSCTSDLARNQRFGPHVIRTDVMKLWDMSGSDGKRFKNAARCDYGKRVRAAMGSNLYLRPLLDSIVVATRPLIYCGNAVSMPIFTPKQ